LHEVLLHIETSLGICSVAVSEGGVLLHEQVEYEPNRAGERLHVMINNVIEAAGRQISELQAVSICGGPGSYTGLRIGVAAAKGVCYALNIPLIHVETFQTMHYAVKHRLKHEADYYIGMIDARRMDAYTAVMDTEGNYLAMPEAVTLGPESFREHLQEGTLIMGTAVEKFQAIQPAHTAAKVTCAELLASDTVALSYRKFADKSFENLFYYEPLYYKAVYLAKN